MRLTKLCIFSFLLCVASFDAHAEKNTMLPDIECLDWCEMQGFTSVECRQTCPRFTYVGGYIRQTKRYSAYRYCITKCMQDYPYKHYYLCATQDCYPR
jgi:hypothetical protein